MPLSVMYSNGGSSHSHLFKPARPIKDAGDPPSAGSGDQKAAGQARLASVSAIDSTGIGTAHIAAALTVYMSTLSTVSSAGSDTPEALTNAGHGAGIDRSRNRPSSSPRASAGSGAADLLRVLDAYAS